MASEPGSDKLMYIARAFDSDRKFITSIPNGNGNMKVAILGCGNLGGSFIKGLVGSKTFKPKEIVASDPDESKLSEMKKLGVRTASDNREAARESKVVFLAVKPGLVGEVLSELDLTEDKLLVSLAAGVSTSHLKEFTGTRTVRVMPNICGSVSEMASAFALGTEATEEDGELVEDILSSLGVTVEVEEDLMDAVTGLSGSGPAFVFLFIEGMKRAGQSLGLSEEDSLKLAAQTVRGSAELAMESDKTLEELVDMVSSPKGTTIEGVKVLKDNKFQEMLEEVVRAAAGRAEELSR